MQFEEKKTLLFPVKSEYPFGIIMYDAFLVMYYHMLLYLG